MALALESTGARMSRLGACLLHDVPVLSVEELIERIDSVETPALRELSQHLFDTARLSVAGVGPDEEVFQAALEPLGATQGAATGPPAAAPSLAAKASRR
jgi:hypothetical protein